MAQAITNQIVTKNKQKKQKKRKIANKRRQDPELRKKDDDEQQKIIMAALERCGGNQTKAAAELGVSRRTLINRLESYGLKRPRKKE